MPTFDETLAEIAKLLRLETKTERDRRSNFQDAERPKAFRDERDAALVNELERLRADKKLRLDELLRYPPFHDRHFSKIHPFHNAANGSFEKCVFIMTKFPEGTTTVDAQLRAVIDTVQAAVTEAGYVPRIASEQPPFHNLLWDNVELYLLGSSRGIAILESKYKPELNPNVAMEWGWMRGMGRQILPLVEKDFAYQRADWGGLIESRFEWDSPDVSVRTAVKAWLAGQPVTHAVGN